jgi:N6-L-threonylcarbamoyladenine synthase
MPPRLAQFSRFSSLRSQQCLRRPPHRCFTVLAIESSWYPQSFPCFFFTTNTNFPRSDDTSVAVLDTPSPTTAKLVFHETVTSANKPTGGVNPFVAIVSHRRAMAGLLEHALRALPSGKVPDLIAVTRGPGMASNLGVGLDCAKGLAVAFRKPLVGVHHMLAHTVTPRLVSALVVGGGREAETVEFPFLTVLASGGHTLLVESRGLLDHTIVSDTIDIAIGDMLDKAARMILPAELLATQGEVISYGRVLEQFSLPNGEIDYKYSLLAGRRREEAKRKAEMYGDWNLPVPLARTPRPDAFSFSGLGSAVERVHKARPKMSWEEKAELGRELMMIAFEHVADRLLTRLRNTKATKIQTVVVSGGVASNRFFRYLLQRYLDHHGCGAVKVIFPPSMYCVDNAAMIAWAGAELYRAGYHTSLDVMPIRKWSMDNEIASEENESEALGTGVGGILGVRGWINMDQTARLKIRKT